MLKRSYV